MRLAPAFLSLLPLILTGCALTSTAPPTPITGAALRGTAHGGQQAISGARVYLLAANTAGYNIGAATYASTSLLNATSTGHADAIGAYVLTDANGNFSITGDYTCTPDANGVPGQQAYLYISGGNSGGGTNAAIGLMAILGDCPSTGNFATATPNVNVNEVTTIAAAYAMAGFAYDATHVSSSGTNLAKVGIKNAFANASNLATLATGSALSTTPAGNGTAPQATVNTLANILAACINTNGIITGPTNPTNCYTLFYNAENGSTVPSDTATAAINIAHNPGANIANLWGLPTGTPPFGSALNNKPFNFTLAIQFSGGGLSKPTALAIDKSGNAWITDANTPSVIKLSPLGVPLFGGSGFTGNGLSGGGWLDFTARPIVIDGAGNIWTGNSATVIELSPSGAALSGSNGFAPGGSYDVFNMAVSGQGDIWITDANNAISELSGSGQILMAPNSQSVGTSAQVGTTITGIGSDAIDGSGSIWLPFSATSPPDYNLNGVSKVSSSGAYQLSQKYNTQYVGGTGSAAVDSGGNIWVAFDGEGASVNEFSTTGSLLATWGGHQDGYYAIAMDGAGSAWVSDPTDYGVDRVVSASSNGNNVSDYRLNVAGTLSSIAVDGSGDVWVIQEDGYQNGSFVIGNVIEVIGPAVPVITPIAAGLPSTPTTDGSSNLGTRP
jgi:hypothetical protein